MRARAIGGAVLAALLVFAVVSLRGQVEEPVAAPRPTTPPVETPTTQPRELELDAPRRPARWREFDLPAGTIGAMAFPAHLVTVHPGGSDPGSELTVAFRDGSRPDFHYRPEPGGWGPSSWVIFGETMYVVEVLSGGGDERSTRLSRVDLLTGQAGQIEVRSVRWLEPNLLSVGDELIGIGVSTRNPAEQCAIAIRPSTGGERTVACSISLPEIEAADGAVLIRLPDNSPDGCAVRLLQPGGLEYGLPVFVGYCRHRQVIPLGFWQAYQLDGQGPEQPIMATAGEEHVVLGDAKLGAVYCHGRLYWITGGDDNTPFGTEVHRWRPGSDEVHRVLRSRDGPEFGWPTCAGGTLTVTVRSPPEAGSRLLGVRVLDWP